MDAQRRHFAAVAERGGRHHLGSALDAAQLGGGGGVDAVVGVEDDGDGRVERDERRQHEVGRVVGERPPSNPRP